MNAYPKRLEHGSYARVHNTRSLAIEQVTAPGLLAEGPLWDSHHHRLLWVDILGRSLHAFDPATGADTAVEFPHETAAVALVAGSDQYLVASGLEVGLVTWPGAGREPLASLDRGLRANDGAVDPRGRFLIGTMADESRDPGGAALYSIRSGQARLLLTGATISNGIDWSLDGRTLYYIDTPLERVDAFDYDLETGELSGRRLFADLHEFPGRPDGLTVDAEGGVWVAMARGGSAVRRFTPDGSADLVIGLPLPNITSVAFGGPTLTDLYVTTSTRPTSAADHLRLPAAGALLRVTGALPRGRAPFEYRR